MAPSRSAKRPKLDHTQRGDDDYVPGNIVEIELRNFMTYDRLVCRPGPRLNLVVGPNGSGKSSLVCAIALALAADPAILGRAKTVKAFVKRGEKSGHVSLSLRDDAPGCRDIRITRKIDTNNKSEWLLDGLLYNNFILFSFRTQSCMHAVIPICFLQVQLSPKRTS
jgi:hypothetical protein